jgi:glycosyltransferase involved in cell wall biosynthesis
MTNADQMRAAPADGSGITPTAYPSVTAVIPTHDRAEPLRRAVRSVLSQRYPGFLQCIVVFDRQRPMPVDVRVGPNRSLGTMPNGRTGGLAGARNTGALAADGELLAWCDDDDEWMPDKLRLQVEALGERPQAPAAGCGIVLLTGGKRIVRSPSTTVVRHGDVLRSRQMWLHSSTLVLRRDRFLGDIGMVDEDIPGSYGEDYEWIVRATAVGALAVVPMPLVRVDWRSSYYSDRWQAIIPALEYHIGKHPDLVTNPRNAARLYGRLAFASAASHRVAEARSWAAKSFRADLREPRGYLALAVSSGLASPTFIAQLARAFGRGI